MADMLNYRQRAEPRMMACGAAAPSYLYGANLSSAYPSSVTV